MLKNFYDLIYVADAHTDFPTAAEGNFGENQTCQTDLLRFEKFLDLQVFAFWEKPSCTPWLEWQRICRYYEKFVEAMTGFSGGEILKQKSDIMFFEKPCGILALEGVDCFAWFDDKRYFLDCLKKMNFKIIGFFWNNDNWLGCGADSNQEKALDYGLNLAGKRFLEIFAEYSFIMDLAHSSYKSFYDCVNLYQKPFMVSHACCGGLVSHKRNLQDDQLRLLGLRGGFVGIAFYPYFLTGSSEATLDDIVEHVRYAVNLAGEDAVGLGSDFDGMDILPAEIIGSQSLPKLADRLLKKGFKYSVMEKIMGLNLKNFLLNNLE